MAILAPDYNPQEVTMYLKKKNPDAHIELELLDKIYVIHCSLPPEDLIIPRGWRFVNNILTNGKKTKKKYSIVFV